MSATTPVDSCESTLNIALPKCVDDDESLNTTLASTYFVAENILASKSESKRAAGAAGGVTVAGGIVVAERIDLKHAKVPVKFARRYFTEKAIVNQNKRNFLPEVILFILFVLLLNYTFLSDRELFYASFDLRRKLAEVEASPMSYAPGSSPADGPHYKESFETILNTGDWNRWLKEVLIPFYFDPLNRDAKPQSAAAFPNSPMIPLGGIRIRTLRVTNSSCSPTTGSTGLSLQYIADDYFYARGSCYGHYSSKDVDKRDIPISTGIVARYQSCNDNIRSYYGYENTFSCSGQVIDLSFNMSFNEAYAIAEGMVASNFFHPEATRLISVHAMHALPSRDALAMSLFFVETGPGGHIFPYIQIFTNRLIDDSALALAVVVFVWCAFLLMKDFGKAVFDCVANRVFDAYLGAPLLFALFVRVCIMIFCLLIFVSYTLTQHNQRDADTLDNPAGRYILYSVQLEGLMQYYYTFRYVAAACAILMCFRLIYFLQVIRRLRVLSMVLLRALPFIVGILVYFVAVLIPFFVAGTYLYGNRLEGYSSLARSIETVALIIVGIFDYAALEELHPRATFFYFWAVNILTLFLLINFIMAILSFTFEMLITKQDKEREESIIAQAQRNSKPGSNQSGSKGSTKEVVTRAWGAFLRFAFSNALWNVLRALHDRRREYARQAEALAAYKDNLDGTFNERIYANRREALEHLAWADYPLFQATARKYGSSERGLLILFEECYIAYMAVEKAEKAIELDEAPELSMAMKEGLRAFLTVLEVADPKMYAANSSFNRSLSASSPTLSRSHTSILSSESNPSARGGIKSWSAVLTENRQRVVDEVHRVTAQAALMEAANLAFLDVRQRYSRDDLLASTVIKIVRSVAAHKSLESKELPLIVTINRDAAEGTEMVSVTNRPDFKRRVSVSTEVNGDGVSTTSVGHVTEAQYEALLSCTSNLRVLREMVLSLGAGNVVYPRPYRAEKAQGVRELLTFLEEHGPASEPQEEQLLLMKSTLTLAPAVTKNVEDASDKALVPVLAEALSRIRSGNESMLDEEAFDGHWRNAVLSDTVADDSKFNQEHELLEAFYMEQVSIPAIVHDTIVDLLIKDDAVFEAFEQRYMQETC